MWASYRLRVLVVLLLCAARGCSGSVRPLGAPFSMAFKDLTIACRAEQQPAASSLAEQWTIEREPRQPLGRVCFQVNTEAKVARVVTFELGDDDEEEDLSSFILAALGARISQFDIRVVLPMEVTPMIELAVECLSEEDKESVVCCDSDGRPIAMSVPREFALKHRIWRLEGEGNILTRGPSGTAEV